jgi:hypothetical protein
MLNSTGILVRKSRSTNQLISNAIKIKLHPDIMNWEDTSPLSKLHMALIHSLEKRWWWKFSMKKPDLLP